MKPFPTICLFLAPLLPAQDLTPKAAPAGAPVVLKNATIHTIDAGIVLGGSLWFADGKIGAVLPKGSSLGEIPDGEHARVVDLQGAHVYPGLISAHTALGLVEIGMVRQTVDVDELGDLTPEALASVAINPDSAAIPVARSNGILAAGVFPRGGILPGRVSVIQLDGWTNEDLEVRADAGPIVAWPSSSGRLGRFHRRTMDRGAESPQKRAQRRRQTAIDAFTRARAWLDAYTADPSTPIDIRHLALAPALRGEVPVFVIANELEQIESAVLWATSAGLHPVIVGGRDAALCAPLLRERHVPVILDGTHRLPRREDSPYDECFTLPKRLADAGVDFCIATGSDFSNDRNLPYHAATAVAFGLSAERALRAITLDAARILGVGDRLGSIAKGKEATLFVSTGSPLDLKSRISMAFVQGREVDLRNKQTELAKKYRTRYRQMRTK